MTRVRIPHPRSFLGGVTQQSDVEALPNQARAQDNCWCSIVDGLSRRHPTEYVAQVYPTGNAHHGGPIAKYSINRGKGERYDAVLGHREPVVFDLETGASLPVVSRQNATIEFLAVPTTVGTDPKIVFDPLTGGARTITMKTGGGTDADPNFFVDTTVSNTTALLASALVAKARTIKALGATLYVNGSNVEVVDNTLGDNASLAVASLGDSADSIRIELNKFQAMKALTGAGVPLFTPEDMSLHITGAIESPGAGAPDLVHPWKYFGTALSMSYNDSNLSSGPYGGRSRATQLIATKNADGQHAYFYYRHVRSSEGGTASNYNKFCTPGKWQKITLFVNRQLASSNNTVNVDLGFLNVATTAWKRAQATFDTTTGDITGTAIASGSVKHGYVNDGFGFARFWVAYKTVSGEEAQQRTPVIYFDFPAGSATTKQLVAYGFLLEENLDDSAVSAPGDFIAPPNEAYRFKPIADTWILANTQKTVIVDPLATRKRKPYGLWRLTGHIAVNDEVKITTLKETGAFDANFRWVAAANPIAVNPYEVTRGANKEEDSKNLADKIKTLSTELGVTVFTRFEEARVFVFDTLYGDNPLFLTEVTDAGGAITTVVPSSWDDIYLSPVRVTAGASYFVRIAQGEKDTQKLKAGAVVNAVGGGSTVAPPVFCQGAHGTSQSLCENGVAGGATAAQATDPDYGIWRTTGTNTVSSIDASQAAFNLAYRNNATTNEEDQGIYPRLIVLDPNALLEVVDNVIHIRSATAFTRLDTEDSMGGDGLLGAHGTVKQLVNLPAVARDGDTLTVLGSEEEDSDDVTYEFQATVTGTFGKGVWVPSVAPAAHLRFDPTTMPVQIQRKIDADGSVTLVRGQKYAEFSLIPWVDKAVGNDTTNSDPTFVGGKFRDLEFGANRLAFVSGVNAIGSVVADYFNFWRTETIRLADDDPFDVASSSGKASPLQHIVAFNDRFVLFSDTTLFVLGGVPTLTPKSVFIRPLEEFESSPECHPFAAERSVFFAHKRGDYTGVHELFPSEESQTLKSLDITKQVAAYIAGQAVQIAVSTLEDTLAIVTDASTRYVYIFKFDDEAQRRLQAAWFRYDFGAGAQVRAIGFVENDLWMLVQRTYEMSLERMRIANKAVDPGVNYLVSLDRKCSEDMRGFERTLSGSDTIIKLPYRLDTGATAQIIRRDTGAQITSFAVSTDVGSVDSSKTVTTLTVTGVNLTNVSLWVGQAYTSTYEFSDVMEYDANQEGIASNRLQLINMVLSYADTRGFSVSVTPRGGVANTQTFAVPDPDASKSPAATPPNLALETGERRLDAPSRSQETIMQIVSSAPFPFHVHKCEFLADRVPVS